VIAPFVAVVVAVVALWNRAVGWTDLALLGGFYVVTAFAITIGYHRLLTHRSFQTTPRVQHAFALLGSFALQGSVISWVADHRKHHAHTDRDGDPHSPHAGHNSGIVRGLLHAHVGWMFTEHGRATPEKYARDLVEDPVMRRIDALFPLWAVLTFALPAALGWVLSGLDARGALGGLLWGGFVRVFLLHHVTWSINSICHWAGRRRFATEDHSTNNLWLALPSLGEAWHHNHHTFPRSAQHGLRWYEADPTAWVIRGMEKLGLAWNVVRISPERQQEKLLRAG
jgi:stearoyl-CoA desaturase (delta-9 desaturase)